LGAATDTNPFADDDLMDIAHDIRRKLRDLVRELRAENAPELEFERRDLIGLMRQTLTILREDGDIAPKAASDGLSNALYVSPIPAGTGKSQSIAAFARALASSPAHSAAGMLILVNRIAEAQDMAEALVDHADRLCIYTSDANVNALGHHTEANDAQICIATQAALKTTLKTRSGQSFDTASRFHYHRQRHRLPARGRSPGQADRPRRRRVPPRPRRERQRWQ
jgi:hypothetical protein